MKRKLVRQGHNTLTLSLPKEWCDLNKLKEGEEVEVGENLNCLVISKEHFRGKEEIKVDITGLDRSTIILLIQSLYTYGHNLITITSRDSKAKHHLQNKEHNVSSVINNAVSRLIGAEIISSSKDTYQIQVLADESREKFDVIHRRIFLLISEMLELFVDGIKQKNHASIESLDAKHINVKRFINYALRILNKFGHEHASKTPFYFAIISFLGKIDEIIKNIAGYAIGEGSLNMSKKGIELAEEVTSIFNLYHKVFYKYDLKQIGEIVYARDTFKSKLYTEKQKSLSKEDIFILSSLLQLSDVILDLTELRMAIEY